MISSNPSSTPKAANGAVTDRIVAWYCVRTKPKHEHIAATNVLRHGELEVFCPRLRVEHMTRRGKVRQMEPLFPCYVFVRCVIEEKLDDLRYTNGVGSVVNFGGRIASVPDDVVSELQ